MTERPKLTQVPIPAPESRTEPTQEELSAAFDRVKNPANWKLHIDTLLPGTLTRAEMRLIEDAVIHFTGSLCEIVPDDGHGNNPGWGWQDAEPPGNHPPFWRVTAAGYYVCIGS